MGSSTFVTVGYFEYHYYCTDRWMSADEGSSAGDVVCCYLRYLTSTDPLRIQPWSQDRRNQSKSNREQFWRKKSRESRQNLCVARSPKSVICTSIWAAVPLLLLISLIPLRHRWRIYCCTLRTNQLVGTNTLLYRLYTTTFKHLL